MIIDNKLTEYKNNIETLQAIESLEVYRWLLSLGDKIKELREDKRISIRGLGRLTDVSGMHISNIEKNIDIDINIFRVQNYIN